MISASGNTLPISHQSRQPGLVSLVCRVPRPRHRPSQRRLHRFCWLRLARCRPDAGDSGRFVQVEREGFHAAGNPDAEALAQPQAERLLKAHGYVLPKIPVVPVGLLCSGGGLIDDGFPGPPRRIISPLVGRVKRTWDRCRDPCTDCDRPRHMVRYGRWSGPEARPARGRLFPAEGTS